jgi:hypothetical protein
MKRFGYTGDKRYTPLSAWGYFGLTMLFLIPVIGQICLLVFACSGRNINRRSFARAWLLPLLLLMLVIAVMLVVSAAGLLAHWPALESLWADATQWAVNLWENAQRIYAAQPTPTAQLPSATATPTAVPFYVPDPTHIP